MKKGRFEPAHALALSLSPKDAVHCCNLSGDSQEARQWINGMTLSKDGEKGWQLVCVDGYSLGWGKLAGGILKNHYPKGLRKQCDRCAVCATRRRRSRYSVYNMQEPKKEENIMRFTLDYDQYAALARQTAAEGCVLLKMRRRHFRSEKERQFPCLDGLPLPIIRAEPDRAVW